MEHLKPFSQRYQPYLLSGILFGLSWPSYPYIHLEVLAWVWMVPMLLALKSVTSLGRFLLNVYLTTLVVCLFGMSWLLVSSPWGAVLLFFVGAVVFAVPFVGFYFIRRTLGWRAALWSAPVVWTAWEWVYHQTEGSFGWLAMGYTQSNFTWLFQFVDITGVWGITFWLVLFNIVVVMAVEDCGVQSTALRRALALEETPAEAGTLSRLQALAVMLVVPLAYSAYTFLRAERASSEPSHDLSVLLVQPNINPWHKMDQRPRAETLAKAAALTDAAVAGHTPDLIIWPETAIPYVLLRETAAQQFVVWAVAKWKAPLLTGTLDARVYDDPSERPPLLKYEDRDYELFNAAVLLEPGTGNGERGSSDPSPITHGESPITSRYITSRCPCPLPSMCR
jgi:apolipoprotein N-acyltransferase